MLEMMLTYATDISIGIDFYREYRFKADRRERVSNPQLKSNPLAESKSKLGNKRVA